MMKRYMRSQRGATQVEYGLLVGLIAVGLLLILTTMGGDIKAVFCRIDAALSNVLGTTTSCDGATTEPPVATAPDLQVDKTTVAWANGVTGSQTVTLTNAGTAAGTITKIALGTTSSVFTLGTTTCGTTLDVGASCTITVTSGTLEGSDVLNITHDGGTVLTIPLSEVRTGALSSNPSTLDWGTVAATDTATDKTLTITNSGGKSITISTIGFVTANGYYTTKTVSNQCANATDVAAQATCSVTVALSSSSATGTLSNTLRLSYYQKSDVSKTLATLDIPLTANRTLGSLYAWGLNTSYQLGDGSLTDRIYPVAVSYASGKSFVQIANSSSFTCGLDLAGSAYCWVGNSTKQTMSGTFTMLVASTSNVCGLNSSGEVYCWTSSLTETKLTSSYLFTTITAGQGHYCGLTSDGTAYCWGGNSSYQLGNGANTTASTPVAVSTTYKFKAISAGANHTCALTATDGTAYCWGKANNGECGNGSKATVYITTPQSVNSTEKYSDIKAGDTLTVALQTNGKVAHWGAIGLGSALSPTTVTLGTASTTAKKIAAGRASICALASDGTAYCWGYNTYGQLGIDVTAGTGHSTAPILVKDSTGTALTTKFSTLFMSSGAYNVFALTQ